MSGEALCRIRGIPEIPSITDVNVRGDAGTNQPILFKIPVGSSGLTVLDVKPDLEQNGLNEKIYQWFHVVFHGGATGWVRDDLIEVTGDLTRWGYPALDEPAFAFDLVRGGQSSPVGERDNLPVDEASSRVFKDALADQDRVRRASFAITAAFEGRGYSAYQNYDHGIVSYGIIQFTLGAGSLATVIQEYVNTSQSDTANKLRDYLPRVIARDALLRHDTTFRDLLITAADEPAMQSAQDLVATNGFWRAVVDGYITHRGLRLPLTWALLFDMGVNFGVNHGFVRLAEQQLGVPPRSRPGENGITEQQLTQRVAELRKVSHDRQAERDNLPGLRRRGDFWMALIGAGDWYLQGDTHHQVNVNGRLIDIR